MKVTIAATAVVLMATAAPAAAQASAKTSPAVSAADLRHRLFLIADDSMKGRDTGSREDSLAAEYIAAEFRRAGLRPAGENGGWFQTVPFARVAPGSATLTAADGAVLRAGIDYVTLSRPTATATPMAEFTAVYAGAANDSSTWLPSVTPSAFLVLDVRAGAQRPALNLASIFGNPRFAQARGIAIVAIGAVDPAQQGQLMRPRVGLDTTRAAVTRPFQMLLSPAAAQHIFGAPIGSLSAGAAAKSATKGDPSPKFAPLAYGAKNIIGILPGRDPALRGQYVSLTAHHDHVGVCSAPVDHDSLRAFNAVYRPMGADSRTWTATPESDTRVRTVLDSLRRANRARPDSICNGADDDGSGTVALLELAEYFGSLPMAQRPRRSILFVSHAAEEVGLVGSQWFTDHPTVPIDSIVAEIDQDMIGRGAAYDVEEGGPGYLEVIGARRLSNEFGDMLEAANKAQKEPFAFNYKFDVNGHPLQYYCRADHYSYARYGIPSVAFSRGEHRDYHQVTDEPQYINYEGLLRVAMMVRDGAMRIGNLDHPPKLDKPKGDPKARCVQ